MWEFWRVTGLHIHWAPSCSYVTSGGFLENTLCAVNLLGCNRISCLQGSRFDSSLSSRKCQLNSYELSFHFISRCTSRIDDPEKFRRRVNRCRGRLEVDLTIGFPTPKVVKFLFLLPVVILCTRDIRISALLLSLGHRGNTPIRNPTSSSLVNPWKNSVLAKATLSRSIRGRHVENFPGKQSTYLVIGLAIPIFLADLMCQPIQILSMRDPRV